jgi:hypothetical protein
MRSGHRLRAAHPDENTSEQREQCDVGPLVLMMSRWAVGVAPILAQERLGMPQGSRNAKIMRNTMKTITMLVATAALITGIAAANAQGTTKQMDE